MGLHHPVLLIGVYGKAESGKDTIGNFLRERKGATKGAFAYTLKEVIGKQVLGLSDEQLYGSEKEFIDSRYNKSPRQLLQYIGTDVFRNMYEPIWVETEMRRFLSFKAEQELLQAEFDGPIGLNPPTYVICDVRFRNEMQAIKYNNGYMWKIVREDHHGAVSGIKGHASEVDMEGVPDSYFDLVIKAKTGELDKIYSIVDKEYERIAGV